jgi:fructokinase
MKESEFIIAGIGELLWDIFPEGKRLGGAPANFAYHASMLGNKAVIVSRVGTDDLGREMVDSLKNFNLDTNFVQSDELVPTGSVTVEMDSRNQPEYIITEDVAWDYLEWTEQWESLAKQVDAVCFGSLAQRSSQSHRTIRRFLRSVKPQALRVFDINLCAPYYTAERITESLTLADILKLNEAELPQLFRMLGLKSSNLRNNCKALLDNFGLQMVCLTRGQLGCMLVTEKQIVENQGFKIKVSDPVGAGDAFTAALVHHYLRKAPLDRIAEAANRLGSYVASKPGAMPPIDKGFIGQVTAPARHQHQRR